MNFLKTSFIKLGMLAAGPVALQKKAGETLTVAVQIETPAPLHGVAFKLASTDNLQYIPESIIWGDLFDGSDNVCNPVVEDGLYIELAQMPDKAATPAGTYTAATLQYQCASAGGATISLQDFIATRYKEDLSIEQYETGTQDAQVEIVMQDSSGKVIARVVVS